MTGTNQAEGTAQHPPPDSSAKPAHQNQNGVGVAASLARRKLLKAQASAGILCNTFTKAVCVSFFESYWMPAGCISMWVLYHFPPKRSRMCFCGRVVVSCEPSMVWPSARQHPPRNSTVTLWPSRLPSADLQKVRAGCVSNALVAG